MKEIVIGNCFAGEPVSVALIGSVVNSAYMRRGTEAFLAQSPSTQYRVVDPAFPGGIGAVLMALKRRGIDDDVLAALTAHETASP